MRAMIIIIIVVNVLLGTNVKLQQTFHQLQSSAERQIFPQTSAYRRIHQMHYSFTQARFGVLFPSQVSDYNPSRSG